MLAVIPLCWLLFNRLSGRAQRGARYALCAAFDREEKTFGIQTVDVPCFEREARFDGHRLSVPIPPRGETVDC